MLTVLLFGDLIEVDRELNWKRTMAGLRAFRVEERPRAPDEEGTPQVQTLVTDSDVSVIDL